MHSVTLYVITPLAVLIICYSEDHFIFIDTPALLASESYHASASENGGKIKRTRRKD